MIPPAQQWCIQIEVTNDCTRRCANCTRLTAHVTEPFYLSKADFERAAYALRDFPTHSGQSHCSEHKVVGIMGGEPLMHPNFAELVQILCEHVPSKHHRGLWTGLVWRHTRHARLIEEAFGFVNNNTHAVGRVTHSPVLVAVRDAVSDVGRRAQLIDDCWLQRRWSSSVTPKGFFFCEVAAALDWVFRGPGGLPVTEGCWQESLEAFQEQIAEWCPRCGISMNLQGRPDYEDIDDISESNLDRLRELGSPRVLQGDYLLYSQEMPQATEPWRYLR